MQGNGNGVIPAHRSKGVEFAFCPSLPGTFAESLSVTNVLDESNTQVITIKAKVRRRPPRCCVLVLHRSSRVSLVAAVAVVDSPNPLFLLFLFLFGGLL